MGYASLFVDYSEMEVPEPHADDGPSQEEEHDVRVRYDGEWHSLTYDFDPCNDVIGWVGDPVIFKMNVWNVPTAGTSHGHLPPPSGAVLFGEGKEFFFNVLAVPPSPTIPPPDGSFGAPAHLNDYDELWLTHACGVRARYRGAPVAAAADASTSGNEAAQRSERPGWRADPLDANQLRHSRANLVDGGRAGGAVRGPGGREVHELLRGSAKGRAGEGPPAREAFVNDAVDRQLVAVENPQLPRTGWGQSLARGAYWSPAGRQPRVAFIGAHYNLDFSEHYLAELLARHGFGFLGWNTRYCGQDGYFRFDRALSDIGLGVGWLREHGAEVVVLLGNSGGGSLLAAYGAASCRSR